MRPILGSIHLALGAMLTAATVTYAQPRTDTVAQAPIDRHALVSRHNVVLTAIDRERPVSVGNGEFAFNVDITGMQTFIPFNTMSQWGWHSGATPAGTKVEDYQETLVETHGRMVPYPLPDAKHPVISDWLASSPHRINLGRFGMAITRKDGTPATDADIQNPKQELDLWRGVVTSRFEIEGSPVSVETACHPTLDAVAVRIQSPLVAEGRLAVFLACPGNNPLGFANFVGDWTHPGKFELVGEPKAGRADFLRQMDEHTSYATLSWTGGAAIKPPEASDPPFRIVKAEYGADSRWLDVTENVAAEIRDGMLVARAGNHLGPDPAHQTVKSLRVIYEIAGVRKEATAGENAELVIDAAPSRRRITLAPDGGSDRFEVVCAFSAAPVGALPDAGATLDAAAKHWASYWQRGGAIDLSGSTDPRWRELERRIVLSQYLMAVHEAGSLPPQESGLVNNGWFGRFHLEMVWWHAAHWALWDRWPEMNKSMGLYDRILPIARRRAESQGYRGARWPKCIGPDGREWPHEIHSFLIWQQPHPIFFAELDYRAHPTRATLERWQQVVEATADFMATYAFLDPKLNQYVLGPPIHLVSENSPTMTTRNPAFELGYWRFGLRTAQAWRSRMGLPKRDEWETVLKGLSPLPVQDGMYVLHEDVTDMWTTWNFEHPALIGTFGMLPGDGVDQGVMKATLRQVSKTWNWTRAWGWDFPMLAMTAARLGQPEDAVDFLLTPLPGFQFDERGLATGGPFPYFPSNGGLLYAAAMMAAGWDGSPEGVAAPGFPKNGKWVVRAEGLRGAP